MGILESMMARKMGGGASSWDEMKGRPFYDTRKTEEVTIEWDGNTEGKYYIDPSGNGMELLYKVSDSTPAVENLIGGNFTFVEGGETRTMIISEDFIQYMPEFGVADCGIFLVAYTPFTGEGIEIKEAGTYFLAIAAENVRMGKLTYTETAGELKQLEPKFVEGMYYTEAETEYLVKDQKLEWAGDDPGATMYLYTGNHSTQIPFEDGKNYCVEFRGDNGEFCEYEGVASSGTLTIMVGNYGMTLNGTYATIDSDFEYYDNISISSRSEKVHTIDPKYLPKDSGGAIILYECVIGAEAASKYGHSGEELNADDAREILRAYRAGTTIVLIACGDLSYGGSRPVFHCTYIDEVAQNSDGTIANMYLHFGNKSIRIQGDYIPESF